MRSAVRHAAGIFSRHTRLIIILIASLAVLPIALVIVCYQIIEPYARDVTTISQAGHTRVGIVLGAGVTKNGKPYKELQARLDTAAEVLKAGKVDRLLLSGDNRFKDYNEPDAMRDYLVSVKHIDASLLQPDYAGRSTYESCERASKVFGLKQAVIISAGSHLPRAIYLCDHFGVQSTGIASDVEANNSTRRELLARVKAVINTHVAGEPTILGTPINIR